jgi:hypothetical protein
MRTVIFLIAVLSLSACATTHIQKKCKAVQGMEDTWVCEQEKNGSPF